MDVLTTSKHFGASYALVPETCNNVRAALDAAGERIAEYYELDKADLASLDAALSQAFCIIRDEATLALRHALVNQLKRNDELVEKQSCHQYI